MSENWNEGIRNASNSRCKFIAVLADRRLASRNLLSGAKLLDEISGQLPFLVFDHQTVWLNSKTITPKNHQFRLSLLTRHRLLEGIGAAAINWSYPMLFNCIIRVDFLKHLFNRYGSFAEGASPDMNFLARVADIGIDQYQVYDAPCIVTNARHASASNGSSALKTGTINDCEHTRLSGTEAYPDYMENFVTANITGSLARYWSDSRMRQILDPRRFLMSSLLELSYPKSAEAFHAMKISLKRFSTDFLLDPSVMSAIEEVQHSPASRQCYPINSSADLSNSPSLNLLAQIEQSENLVMADV